MTAKTLSNAISVLIDEAELEPGLSAHGLGKFFNAELQSARVPKETRYAMMGKKFGVYDENRATKLLEEYKENYHALTIFGVGEKRVRDLEKEVADLRAELEKRTETLREYSKKLHEYGQIVEDIQETFPQSIDMQVEKIGQIADMVYRRLMKNKDYQRIMNKARPNKREKQHSR